MIHMVMSTWLERKHHTTDASQHVTSPAQDVNLSFSYPYRCRASNDLTEYSGDLGSLCWISISA